MPKWLTTREASSFGYSKGHKGASSTQMVPNYASYLCGSTANNGHSIVRRLDPEPGQRSLAPPHMVKLPCRPLIWHRLWTWTCANSSMHYPPTRHAEDCLEGPKAGQSIPGYGTPRLSGWVNGRKRTSVCQIYCNDIWGVLCGV